MKKITKSLTKRFDSVKLYLEDINEILEEIKKLKTKSIKIITDSHEYGENELDKIEQSPLKLEIIAHTEDGKYINIDFNSHGLHDLFFYSSHDDILAQGLLSVIERKFKSKRRNVFNLLRSQVLQTIILIILIVNFGLNILANKPLGALALLIGIFVFIISIFVLDMFLNKNLLILIHKKNAPNIFQRNKDALFVNVLTALISGIIGVAIGLVI